MDKISFNFWVVVIWNLKKKASCNRFLFIFDNNLPLSLNHILLKIVRAYQKQYMCVLCVCVCVCVCVHACIYGIHMCIQSCKRVYLCFIYIYIYIYNIYIYMRKNVYIWEFIYLYTDIDMHAYVCIQIYVYTNMYVYLYVLSMCTYVNVYV